MKSTKYSFIILPLLIVLTLPLANFTAQAEILIPGAELFLLPDYASFLDKNTLLVDIVVNPESQAINAANINLTFDQTKLAATDINYGDNSFCQFVISQEIDNELGLIKIACGTADNNMATTTTIALITFAKIQSGLAKFNLSGSEVLAADGLGTNILAYPEIHNIYIIK